MPLTRRPANYTTGTTAEWAASPLVLGVGELGSEERPDGSVLLFIGDGIHTRTELREGNYAATGDVVLVGGVATVVDKNVTQQSLITLHRRTSAGTPGWLNVSAKRARSGFTITSSDPGDTSVVHYEVVAY